MNPKISLIAAVSENNVLAKNDKIPWKIPLDYNRYMAKIKDHVIISGRKTFDASYTNTINIVVTRDPMYIPLIPADVVHSVPMALAKARELEKEDIYVIGGGEIFMQTIDSANKLYLTLIHTTILGDQLTFFPDYSEFKKISFKEEHEENGYTFTFLDLER